MIFKKKITLCSDVYNPVLFRMKLWVYLHCSDAYKWFRVSHKQFSFRLLKLNKEFNTHKGSLIYSSN